MHGENKMLLAVQPPPGYKAFKLTILSTDKVDALLAQAAKHARLPRAAIRLSRRGVLLMSDRSVESYNLSEADSLTLHIKVGYEPQSDVQRTGPATHSFGSDGYGFFVSVLTPDGKLLFRPKVFPDEAATSLIAEAGSKLRDSLGAAPRAALALHLRGQQVSKDRTIAENGIRAGDELVLHASPSQPKPTEPKSRYPAGVKDPYLEKPSRARSAGTPRKMGWKELVSIPGAVLRQKLAAAERARSTFDSFDRYKRGSIEYKEVRNAVQAYGLDPSAEGAVELLARYDATPESQLSRGEWAELVKSLEEKLGPVGGPGGPVGGAGRSASGLESTLAIREAADLIYDRVFQEARRLRRENRALRRQLGDEEGVIILEPASEYDDQPLRYGAAAAPSAAAAANIYARTDAIVGVPKGGVPKGSVPKGSVAPKGGVPKDGPATTAATTAAVAAAAMEKKIRDAFAAFDENQSGFFDSKKLRNALRLYGIRLDRPEVEQVIARLSLDRPEVEQVIA